MAATDPQVIPMIAYEDAAAALDWLASEFGFRERTRMTGRAGRISHAEMEAGGGLIMLASPTPDYESPRHHRAGCEPAWRWSSVPWVIDGVLVYVDDVVAHHERAKQVGATILSEPEESGPGRRYRAEDVEGTGGCSWSCADGVTTNHRHLDLEPCQRGVIDGLDG